MTKAEKIIKTFEQFCESIIDNANPDVKFIRDGLLSVRKVVSEKRIENPKLTMSQIASGLEEALREFPTTIQSVNPESRETLTKAFDAALSENYPEFVLKEREKLEKVLNRGRIRTVAEYYRVRYEIDLAEREHQGAAELSTLYSLVDEYEARR